MFCKVENEQMEKKKTKKTTNSKYPLQVEMTGFPTKKMLMSGTKTDLYFKKLESGQQEVEEEPVEEAPIPQQSGKRQPQPPPKIYPSHGYKIKTEAEYYADQPNEKRMPFKRYFYYHKLHEIISRYSWPKDITDCTDPEKKEKMILQERKRRLCFTDFLNGLLHTDPAGRWPADLASQHPFITDEELDGMGTFHVNVVEPELERRRLQKSIGESSSLPYATPEQGSLPIDMHRNGVPFINKQSSFPAAAPQSLGISPMPHSMFQTPLGTSFTSSHHQGTPTLNSIHSHMSSAKPIPIPMNSGRPTGDGSFQNMSSVCVLFI